MRLKASLGNDAFWVPPRLWAYASENQPDGIFQDYSAQELAMIVGFSGDARSMLQALLHAGFLDQSPLRIHDWSEHNGYHAAYAARAKTAAEARWQKERSKERDLKGRGKETSNASSNASSMIEAPTLVKVNGSERKYPSEALKAMDIIKRDMDNIRDACSNSKWKDRFGSLLPDAKTELRKLRELLAKNKAIALA